MSGCVANRYDGLSGFGYHASLQEGRTYWRAKGYEFGPEVDTVPYMEELAALYTPQQWQRLPKRRANLHREESVVDLDGSGAAASHGASRAASEEARSVPVTAEVPPPVRKTLPPLE